MERKAVLGIVLTLLFIGMLTAFNVPLGFALTRKITVPDDYPTIQEAINAANPGDTVYVRNGTYYENVVVNKTVALLGENKNTTVIVGVAHSPVWESVISLWADDVKIANLTVTNGGHGIQLFRGKRNTVTDCAAYGNDFGLTISDSSQNFLRRNILFNNSHNLLVHGSWSIDDFIQDISPCNLVDGKPVYYLVNEENLSINPVTFPNVGYLAVVNSNNVQIANLSLSRNGDGLLIAFSPNTLIENVEATYNYYGISLMCSPGTMVKHCNFSYNNCGIFSYYSDHVNIKENNISHNEGGIFSMGSNYGAVYHNNFIENYRYYQARVDRSHSHWDDGYYCGGNYWSDHVCTGNPSDGSQPYIIDENNIDHYPYQDPNSWVMHPRIYIEADGSVDPDTAPISSVDNVTYTFTDNIYGEIVVERDNIVVHGAGYTVQGTGAYDSIGIALLGRSNVTIKNTEIKSFVDGIRLYWSSNNTINGNKITENDCESIWLDCSYNNTISGNSITNNGNGILLNLSDNNSICGNNITANNEYGIRLFESSNNTINGNKITANKWHGIYLWHYSSYNSVSGNNITNNEVGIYLLDSSNDNSICGNNITANNEYGILLHSSSNNAIYHNNFVDNSEQVYSYDSANVWDDGYPSGGNYWSGYELHDQCNGPDQDQPGSDGIGDFQYRIDMFNEDRFPLMRPIKFFDADVGIASNSTVSNFHLNAAVKTISFNVKGETGSGFCRVTIPNIIIQDLWQGNYTVLVDGESPLDIRNWTDNENTYIYFTYQHSEHEVIIVPEFPSAIIMPLFMVISMLAVALAKRKPKMRK